MAMVALLQDKYGIDQGGIPEAVYGTGGTARGRIAFLDSEETASQ
jgi:hypothetical protein